MSGRYVAKNSSCSTGVWVGLNTHMGSYMTVLIVNNLIFFKYTKFDAVKKSSYMTKDGVFLLRKI